jgi:hypothetical protein
MRQSLSCTELIGALDRLGLILLLLNQFSGRISPPRVNFCAMLRSTLPLPAAPSLARHFRQPDDASAALSDRDANTEAACCLTRYLGGAVHPGSAIALSVLKPNGLSARAFGWLADLPRRQADRGIVLGECMRPRLLAHGVTGREDPRHGELGRLRRTSGLQPSAFPSPSD